MQLEYATAPFSNQAALGRMATRQNFVHRITVPSSSSSSTAHPQVRASTKKSAQKRAVQQKLSR
jgi:hypothetical protein